jgi:hypothetical protein
MHDMALLLIGYIVGRRGFSLFYQKGQLAGAVGRLAASGVDQSPSAPRRRQFSIQAAHYDAAVKYLTIGPYQKERATMILTAIIVTGLVFTGIGAVIGYVLGYIEAENHCKIKHGEKP